MRNANLETSDELRETLANVLEARKVIGDIDWSREASLGEVATNGLVSPLSVNEIVHLELARMGLTDRAAGNLLQVSISSVQNRRHILRDKMEVHTMGAAVAKAIRLGILPLDTTDQTGA